ncbi:MAG TPA: Flp family type IVb pilin [Pseudoneobacillus sp.]|jgi:pilus assembly protein Flp/PilA|nr:Flp family type IVb pilin [Pseudoneobacillus sp.]
MKALQSLFIEEQAQGLAEYGIVMGVIAVAVLGVIAGLSENIVRMLTNTLEILTSSEG